MITADDQTAIETAFKDAKGNFKTVLDNLVTAGTLTSDKETAIENALKPQEKQLGEKDKSKGIEKYKEMINTKLDGLVTAGTITTDQETTIIEALTPSK
ncbi:hypothetical protein [Clostridium beijerinckii]|uniref:hypothetical protein n=1 Tax=Clostridium beijerinckii TaxID=1520 RepID=UPI001FACD195|nr:hypothetical protein [Clostridium beijerinckii]